MFKQFTYVYVLIKAFKISLNNFNCLQRSVRDVYKKENGETDFFYFLRVTLYLYAIPALRPLYFMLNESASFEFVKGFFEFVAGIHHYRTAPRYRLAQRSSFE